MAYKETIRSLAIAAVLGFGLVACSGSGGGSSTPAATTTTTTTVNGQSATTVAAVTGTGTTGTTSTSLTVADKISVVSSGSTTAAPKAMPIIKSLNGLLGTKAVPTSWGSTVDYYLDPTFTYVHERSAESLKTPNEILCMVAQAHYDSMVNKGAYKAQIDKNLCSSSKDSASQAKNSATSSSGSGAPDYLDWTVISNRKDTSSPQVVAAWLHETMGGGPGQSTKVVILTKTVIGESSSSTNPYGLFTMNFVAYPENKDGTLGTTEVMHGYLRTVTLASGKVVLQFYDTRTEGTLTMEEATTLYKTSDGSAGSGEAKFPDYDTMYSGSTMPTSVTYKQMRFAYDTASFKRAKVDPATGTAGTAATDTVCLNKDTTKYLTSVWSYGLYDSAGARKTLNSGFPVVYTDTSVTPNVDYYGYVGFWGMWFPDNITLPNPATVNKLDWSSGAPTKTALTAKQSAGKFTKHTRNTTTLDKIKNVSLNYSQCTQSGTTWTCGNYEAHWDGTKFAISQKMGNSGYEALASTDPASVDVSKLQWQSTLNMWSQSLGGQVMIKFPMVGEVVGTTTITSANGCAKSGGLVNGSWTQETYDCTKALTSPSTVPIVYYQDTLLMPGDAAGNITLTCFSGCPQGNKFTTTATGSAFYTEPKSMMTDTGGSLSTNWYTAYAKSYTYSDTAYTLTDNTTTTGGAVGLTTQNTSLTNEWGGTLDYGVQTGALFDPAAVDTATKKTYAELLKCPWDSTAWGKGAQVCPWQAREALPVYYTWETGWNSWNYLTALYNGTTPVKFDQPIRVSYTYPSTATTINPAATDTKFAGVPFQLEYNGFGQLFGIPGHCVNPDNGADVQCGMNVRWIPEFSIPGGETVSDGTNTYYVKALDQEQRMPELAAASCTASLTTYTLPVDADYTKPDIGAEPAVAEPPAVIGGVVVKK